ncbi:hypothetical protein TNCV_1375831 [Trichonephila clavipes]|nr:hypothetical protein TNCV_1375831 [Trichonephila clavipes]
MSRREESFPRKLRHPPEEPSIYGHFKLIKKFKTIKYKIETGHSATQNSAWLRGNTRGIHSNRSRVSSRKWGGDSSGKENETNYPGEGKQLSKWSHTFQRYAEW